MSSTQISRATAALDTELAAWREAQFPACAYLLAESGRAAVSYLIRGGDGAWLAAALEANRIQYADSSESAALASTEIASRGAAVTVRVRCLREAVPAPAPTPKQQ